MKPEIDDMEARIEEEEWESLIAFTLGDRQEGDNSMKTDQQITEDVKDIGLFIHEKLKKHSEDVPFAFVLIPLDDTVPIQTLSNLTPKDLEELLNFYLKVIHATPSLSETSYLPKTPEKPS